MKGELPWFVARISSSIVCDSLKDVVPGDPKKYSCLTKHQTMAFCSIT